MAKSYLGIIIFFGIQQQVWSHTANEEQRVTALKNKLQKEIQEIQLRSEKENLQAFMDNYYDLILAEPSEVAVTKPSLRTGHRHRYRSRKHRPRATANVTTTTNTPQIIKQQQTTKTDLPMSDIVNKTSTITNDTFEENVRQLEEKVEAAIKNLTDYLNQTDKGRENKFATTTDTPKERTMKVTPTFPLYRRLYLNDVERNKPQKWVHCLDLITPRLEGMKDSIRPKELTHNHSDVKRLAQLLFTDVSQYNAEDIVSVLSQISKIRIRMFQWDQTAMTTIFNIIIKGPVHNFRTLKAGIKALFSKWHLDTSMMKVFLEQTRIFRPPCIEITGYSGSTKKPGGAIMYTKPDKPKKKRDPNVSCQSREDHHKHNYDP